jgi:hypothetical protein
MTKNRSLPAGEHRSEPATSHADLAMTKRVDTSVQEMKPPSFEATPDRALAKSRVEQLLPRENTVLLPRKFRQPSLPHGRGSPRP